MFAAALKFYMKQVVLAVIVVLSITLLFSSCANIVPPGGGPRDSLPPRLMAASPKDSALNFTGNRIGFLFDEFVEVKDVQQQLIVSPYTKNLPTIDYKLRNVSVKFKDSLLPNTTYSLYFGNAIRDVNEGNIAREFTYVFSTGKYLDSCTLSGKVVLAETGKIDTTLIVALYSDLADSAVTKKSPRYYAKLNGKGEFKFRYLPGEKVNVFVLEDSYSKKYEDSTKLFAFLNNSVQIKKNTDSIVLYAYKQTKPDEKKPPINNIVPKSTDKNTKEQKFLRFTTNMENKQQSLLNNLVLNFNRKINIKDSTGILLLDTSYKKNVAYNFSIDTTQTNLIIQSNWKEKAMLKLIIAKDALTDTAGNGLAKNDTVSFVVKSAADYTNLRLRFPTIDLKANPVLQFYQNDKLVESVALTAKEFRRRLFIPGEYELRILYDENKNLSWDAGNYLLKRQPEKVRAVLQRLNAKANVEIDTEVVL